MSSSLIPVNKFPFALKIFKTEFFLLFPEFFLDVQNIVHLNGTAWVNFKVFKKLKKKSKKKKFQNSLIVKMNPKQYDLKTNPEIQYETEVGWKSQKNEQVFAIKEFLNGKALVLIRKKNIKEKNFRTEASYISLQFSVMTLNRTHKPKYISKTGILIGKGKANSDRRSITDIDNVLVTGQHGNIVILLIKNQDQTRLEMLTFCPFGAKVLIRSQAKVDLKSWAFNKMEMKATPGSRFVYLCASIGHLWAFEIIYERELVLRAKYSFEQNSMRIPHPMAGCLRGYLSHIFCYSEDRVIVLQKFDKRPGIKFMVFTYKEDMGELVRTEVKNADDFIFRGEVKFYRKNDGKVYFFDQKESIYTLSMS